MAESKATTTEQAYSDLRSGMTVRVYQKITEKNAKGEDKERTQIFEGIILKKRHGGEAGGTITIRKISDGIGVEKIFPLKSPAIEKIDIVKTAKVRRANISYVRTYKKRLKEKMVA